MTEENKVVLIPIDDIIPNRFQPRLKFNEKELQSLAESISAHGIVSPIIVRKIGDKYEIIAGERRFKAAGLIGLTTVPCIIRELDDTESAEVAVIENLQRANLTPIEEAKSYEKLLNKGLTQEQLAKKLGVSQPTIANKVRLLNLCQEVQDALLHNKISERHARSMLQLSDPELQKEILNNIISNRLTVKQTDEEINKMLGRIPSAPGTEDIYNVDIDTVKNSADELFKQKASVDFESLLRKDVVEPKAPESVLPSVEDSIFKVPDIISVPDTVSPAINEEPIIKDDTITILPAEDTEQINPFQTLNTTETIDINESLNSINEKPVETPAPVELEQNNDVMDSFLSESSENKDSGKKLSTAIEKARTAITDLKNLGYNVDTEEFDFVDTYQIIIKIKKED